MVINNSIERNIVTLLEMARIALERIPNFLGEEMDISEETLEVIRIELEEYLNEGVKI